MEIKKRPAALSLAATYAVWELVLQPLWNLNLERLAERQKIDTTLADGASVMDNISSFFTFLPDSFGWGFVVGALIFAFWDALLARIPFLRKSESLCQNANVTVDDRVLM